VEDPAEEGSKEGMAMVLVVKAFFCLLAAAGVGSQRLYFFTAPGCPPCRATEPNIDRLVGEGYPITKVDVSTNPALAGQFGVFQTPTVILVDGQQVLARHSGALNYASLRQLLDGAAVEPQPNGASPPPATALTSQPAASEPNEPNVGSVERRDPAEVKQTSAAGVEQRALDATVRIRVEDAAGTSVASGTIVHSYAGDALVVTCGHVFRDSGGKGAITVDVAMGSPEQRSVPGQLLHYDAAGRDIGLVLVRGVAIPPVPVAPPTLVVSTGDRVFTAGCDHGQPPTLRYSAIKRAAVYNGARKYDTVGRPVDGRSGGGLFSAGGQLIGVCNAAAVEVDEGIYTGLDTIHWQFAQVNLAHLFAPSSEAVASAPSEPPQWPQASSNVGGQEVVASEFVGAIRGPNDQPAGANGSQALGGEPQSIPSDPMTRIVPASNTLDSVPPEMPGTRLAGEADDVELIVIVRQRSQPAVTTTVTVSDPSRQLIDLIYDAAHQAAPPHDRLMADQRGERPTATTSISNVRPTQSPASRR